MQYDAATASTLGALEPELALTLNWRRSRFSPRNQGGLVQNLRTPSRLPDVHRLYTFGDPASRIDWRAYARTDELLIREVHEDAAARVIIFLECTPSMFWPSEEVKPFLPRATLSKWEIAARIAFHLCYAHVKQGDFVHLVLVTDSVSGCSLTKISLRDQAMVSSFFAMVKENLFNGEAKNILLGMSEPIVGQLPTSDAHYLVGDYLSIKAQPNDLMDASPNPIGIHVLNQFEVNVDWFKDSVSYFDHEPANVELPGKFLSQEQRYQASLQLWCASLQKEIEGRGGLYARVTDATRIGDFHNALKQLRGVIS